MIDWNYWANLAVVPYTDACILSRGFDPRQIKGNALPPKLEAELRQRESIAKSHLGRGLPSHQTEADRYYGAGKESGVKLPEFRAWGESLPSPFTFPDDFPKAAEPVVKAPARDEKLDSRERTSLLRIIRALAVMAQADGRGAAVAIEKQLEELGFNGPKQAAIRSAIDAAKALEPDSNPL